VQHDPKVSVVIPVYNGGPYLETCLDSLVSQDLDASEFEVVTVDDGSTDGSGEILDAYASTYPNFHVIHQEKSGWPGQPRNVGTAASRGEFVFYLDDDDFLGPEALRRMYGFVDTHRSDVLLPRMIPVRNVDGCWIPQRPLWIWSETQVDADPRRAFRELRPMKLVRRSFLSEHQLRFPEGKVRLEDGIFVSRAYLAASRVSILADYDYYFLWRGKPSGHISGEPTPSAGYIGSVAIIMSEACKLPDHAARADVLLDVYRRKGLRWFRPSEFLRYSADKREDLVAAVQALAREYIPSDLEERLPLQSRLRSHLIRAGDVDALLTLLQAQERGDVRATLRGGKVLVETLGLPGGDRVDVSRNVELVGRIDHVARSGRAYVLHLGVKLKHLITDPFTPEVFLRERATLRELGLKPARPAKSEDGWHRFSVPVPLKELVPYGDGRWDVNLRARFDGKVELVRPSVGDLDVDLRAIAREQAGSRISPYVTSGSRLALNVRTTGDRSRRARSPLEAVRRTVRNARGAPWRYTRGLAITLLRGLGLKVRYVGERSILISQHDDMKTGRLAVGASMVWRDVDLDLIDAATGLGLVMDRGITHSALVEQEAAILRHILDRRILHVLSRSKVNLVVDVGPDPVTLGRSLRKHGYAGHILSLHDGSASTDELLRAVEGDPSWEAQLLAPRVAEQDRLGSNGSSGGSGNPRPPVTERTGLTWRLLRSLDELSPCPETADPDPRRIYLKVDSPVVDLRTLLADSAHVERLVAVHCAPPPPLTTEPDAAFTAFVPAHLELEGVFPLSANDVAARQPKYTCLLVRRDTVSEAQLASESTTPREPRTPT
jgi:glycosyltransferase involved in cell wall biosynthesis